MVRRRPTALLLLALAAAPALAACGGDGEATPGLAAPGSVTAGSTTTGAVPGGGSSSTVPTAPEIQRPAKALRCPSPGPKGGESPSDGFDARELLGLRTADAQALARRHGCVLRVVVRDGQELVRTMDFSSARVNVVELTGRVVALDGIG